MSLVSFFNADVKPVIKNKSYLKSFLPLLFANEKKKLKKLSVVFCSDDYLLSLNQQYLNHDFYTDILTFDLSEDENIIGEIYISTDRILDNSIQNKVSFQHELNRIAIHGCLHLCGYLDKSIIEKKVMTEKEDFYLIKLNSFHVKQQ